MTGYSGPGLLAAHHAIDHFNCCDDALNDWLRARARGHRHSGASRTWVVTDHARRVVGYDASSTAVVMRASAAKRAARNQPEPMPALLLGRLAVDREHQGRGLAAALLKHFLLKCLEVAQVTGVRVVLVHAKDDRAAAFYRHFHFEPSPIDERTLMLLIRDLAG